MNTKYNIGDKVLIEVTVKAIRAYKNDSIEYYVADTKGLIEASIEEKDIYLGPPETKFADYLDEQMKDPEFKKEYDKLDEEFEKKIIISTGFRNAIRDAVYRTGDAACNVSKTLGLPANCLTNIILGHTKKIAYGRLCWICTALNITEEDIING